MKTDLLYRRKTSSKRTIGIFQAFQGGRMHVTSYNSLRNSKCISAFRPTVSTAAFRLVKREKMDNP